MLCRSVCTGEMLRGLKRRKLDVIRNVNILEDTAYIPDWVCGWVLHLLLMVNRFLK